MLTLLSLTFQVSKIPKRLSSQGQWYLYDGSSEYCPDKADIGHTFFTLTHLIMNLISLATPPFNLSSLTCTHSSHSLSLIPTPSDCSLYFDGYSVQWAYSILLMPAMYVGPTFQPQNTLHQLSNKSTYLLSGKNCPTNTDGHPQRCFGLVSTPSSWHPIGRSKWGGKDT